MVYDGNCGFCKYWIVKWKKITGSSVEYKPYQEVANTFSDIDTIHFKEAVRYITTDGEIVNGPDAAYITYSRKGALGKLHRWYQYNTIFMHMSDHLYQWVADNRGFMFRISKLLFGRNPDNTKSYWLIYLILLIALLVSLVFV